MLFNSYEFILLFLPFTFLVYFFLLGKRPCGGAIKVIACIEDPVVIKKILTYLEEKLPTRAALLLPDSRAPPQSGLFG